ncbi:MAG: hypothetical protein ACKPKO_41465, partial [Candidatus Fonsibacter sp.]
FMRIKSIPVFNEFDTWQAYEPEEPINNMSLYIVEASSFDPFFNKTYNLCYGYFLKQLKNWHEIKAAKHPSINKGELQRPRGGALEDADQRRPQGGRRPEEDHRQLQLRDAREADQPTQKSNIFDT